MNRTFLLIAGVVCWTAAGADALVHLVGGDLVGPSAMVGVLALWVVLRVLPARRAAAVPAPIADPA
jgi:hypothetical protein